MIKEVFLTTLTGAGVGIVFALFKLPVPAPPVFALWQFVPFQEQPLPPIPPLAVILPNVLAYPSIPYFRDEIPPLPPCPTLIVIREFAVTE
jgi:XapX domain-containing protein